MKVVEAKENKPLSTLVNWMKAGNVQGNTYRGAGLAILEGGTE
jgi:hypothetical protein